MFYQDEIGYQNLIKKILEDGNDRGDRTGTGTRSIFGPSLAFNVSKRFPLFTCRKIYTKGIIGELCGFLRGATNNDQLKEFGCNYWTPWAEPKGYNYRTQEFEANSLGPIYGAQWRNFNGEGYDQITRLIQDLKFNPESRRHLVSAWNPNEMHTMALPPCFHSFQCYVNNGTLDMICMMRSSDVIVGLPSDCLFHGLLLKLIAQEVGLNAGQLIMQLGDAHIYNNHMDAAHIVKARKIYFPPTVTISETPTVEVTPEHITITDYVCQDPIKLEVAV